MLLAVKRAGAAGPFGHLRHHGALVSVMASKPPDTLEHVSLVCFCSEGAGAAGAPGVVRDQGRARNAAHARALRRPGRTRRPRGRRIHLPAPARARK